MFTFPARIYHSQRITEQHACQNKPLLLPVAAYSRKKAEMIAERERREAEKRAIKDLERKRIADNIEQAYLAFTSKEEGRVAREVAEAEVKATADEAARRQRIKDTQAAIDRSRQAQLKAKVCIVCMEDGAAGVLNVCGCWVARHIFDASRMARGYCDYIWGSAKGYEGGAYNSKSFLNYYGIRSHVDCHVVPNTVGSAESIGPGSGLRGRRGAYDHRT